MTHLELSVLNYLLNALWQVPLVFLFAALAARMTASLGPQTQHRIWVTALVLESILPACAFAPGLRDPFLAFLSNRSGHVTTQISIVNASAGAGTRHIAAQFADAALIAYGLALLYLGARLIVNLYRTRGLRRAANRITLTGESLTTWQHCSRTFGVSDAQLATSTAIAGPSTIGIRRRIVLLPPALLTSLTSEDLAAALAHEFAHMRRRDFAKNLFYQLIALPIAWHPFLRLTSTRLAASREMVCDELAAQATSGSIPYARSLLRLAAMFLRPRPAATAHAIGILDANDLERRVMTLTRKTAVPTSLRRIAIAAAVLLGAATCASAMSFRFELPAQAIADTAVQQPGSGGNLGHVYKIGGSVRPPIAVYAPDPQYTQEARKAKQSGNVVVALIVDQNGNPREVHVARGLGNQLDQKAVEAVQQYRFKPATRNGEPVAVSLKVEVNFQIF